MGKLEIFFKLQTDVVVIKVASLVMIQQVPAQGVLMYAENPEN